MKFNEEVGYTFSPDSLRRWVKQWHPSSYQIKFAREDLYAELERVHRGQKMTHCCDSYENLVECVAIVDDYREHGLE